LADPSFAAERLTHADLRAATTDELCAAMRVSSAVSWQLLRRFRGMDGGEAADVIVEAGAYVSLPADVPHRLRVVGEEEPVMLQIHADPSLLESIRAASAAAARGRPGLATADTGQPVLGPPMSAEEGVTNLSAAT